MSNINKGYFDIANAIVKQAAEDYRAALRDIFMSDMPKAKKEKIEIEDFFRSDWYATLTSLDPEILISLLKTESESHHKEWTQLKERKKTRETKKTKKLLALKQKLQEYKEKNREVTE